MLQRFRRRSIEGAQGIGRLDPRARRGDLVMIPDSGFVNESPAWGLSRPSGRSLLAQRAFIRSVSFALEGIAYAFRTQRNVRIQSAAGAGALTLAIVLRLPVHQTVLVAALTALVLFAELMNTAIEATLDHRVGTTFDPSVKRIKDIAAASVLVVSLGAAALGASMFLPALALRFFR